MMMEDWSGPAAVPQSNLNWGDDPEPIDVEDVRKEVSRHLWNLRLSCEEHSTFETSQGTLPGFSGQDSKDLAHSMTAWLMEDSPIPHRVRKDALHLAVDAVARQLKKGGRRFFKDSSKIKTFLPIQTQLYLEAVYQEELNVQKMIQGGMQRQIQDSPRKLKR